MSAAAVVLPPSALSQHAPRHGRSRAASMKGKSRYNLVEDPDVTIAKALMFVLKRTVLESEVDEDDEEDDRLVADADEWVSVEDVLAHPRITALNVDVETLQRIVSSASKTRFTIQQRPGSDPKEPASYRIRRIANRNSLLAPVPVGEPLTPATADLPDFVLYETTYHSYPLILASGGIQRPGGTQYLAFTPVTVAEDGSETRPTASADAEVSIWVNLRAAMEAGIVWQRTESGSIVTAGELPTSLWTKAVARRADIGVLFEDGEARKEVPAALRGKKAKGKAKSGKGALRRGTEEDSESASAGEGEVEGEE